MKNSVWTAEGVILYSQDNVFPLAKGRPAIKLWRLPRKEQINTQWRLLSVRDERAQISKAKIWKERERSWKTPQEKDTEAKRGTSKSNTIHFGVLILQVKLSLWFQTIAGGKPQLFDLWRVWAKRHQFWCLSWVHHPTDTFKLSPMIRKIHKERDLKLTIKNLFISLSCKAPSLNLCQYVT